MNRARFGELEVLCRTPAGTARPTPLLFVHGAYTNAQCWQLHFVPFFNQRGFDCYALDLSGHGESSGHDRIDDFGLDDYADDVARAVDFT